MQQNKGAYQRQGRAVVFRLRDRILRRTGGPCSVDENDNENNNDDDNATHFGRSARKSSATPQKEGITESKVGQVEIELFWGVHSSIARMKTMMPT